VNYVVRLDAFEGPLDLLLYLIQREEMDIYDIPIARITEQYLRYVENMEQLDLTPAGEFLVMAATLMRIKARLLLPVQRQGDEAAEDPRHELVQRLLEYKKFKEAARKLEEHESQRANYFTRPLDPAFVEELKAMPDEVTFEVSMPALMKALAGVLARFETVATHEVKLEPVSLEERVGWLRETLLTRPRLAWSELFVGVHSRIEVIVTFIAVLELAKIGALRVHQADPASELWVWSRAGEPAPAAAELATAADETPSPAGAAASEAAGLVTDTQESASQSAGEES
jgi:segregation and condensation protein A